uniref:Glycerophosphodiester phosphodiesterase domain containing 2 n=1 Tax=Xenopus tropicalis TaxID=8364 RepID=A0A803JEG5_XENTR
MMVEEPLTENCAACLGDHLPAHWGAGYAMAWDGFWSSCCLCLQRIYGCNCRKNRRGKLKGTKGTKCECIWVLLLLLVFFFTLIWMLITLTLGNDMHNFNEEVFRFAGIWLDWSVVFLTVAAVLLTYCGILMLLSFCLVLCGLPIQLHWCHKVLFLLSAIVIILLCVGLSLKWREEWQTAYIYMQATLPFLHIGAVIGVSALAWVLAGYYWRTKTGVLKYLILTVYIILLGALYPLPVYITSPCVLKSSDLPPKPGLIGHRGAPMLAPENTLMSFNKTVASGIKVFETDVAISQDGVPFLMHDSKLLRTTNVREIFQEQSQYNSTNFTWANLQKLDAGSWYLEKDPFKTVSVLTPQDQEEVRRQKIPALQEVLKEAEKNNISIIFDLYVPPEDHPYNDSYIDITLETIFNSSIRPELILWLPDEQREEVIARAPGFRQIFGPLKQENYTLEAVNMPYNLSLEKIRSYRQKNISVNLYVVNEPWLFSYVWCAGATSVTSNACHLLKNIQRPQWVLDPQYYVIIWIVVDAISLAHVIWAFIIQRTCSKRKEYQDAETVLLMKIGNSI